jgi:hypothetical protein
MAFEKLSAAHKQIVLSSMRATCALIEDTEKHTRLGLSPDELQAVIDHWPYISDNDDSSNGFLAVNNCLNEVCNGLQIPHNEWTRWFDCTEGEVKAAYLTWLALRGVSGGIR